MGKRMLVNAAQEGEVRVATVENNVLEDLNVAIEGNELLKGNIYKAVVVSVESGLQAAFVDYGADRNGFITFNDIHRRYYNKKIKSDGKRLRIQDAVAPGAELLVQVYKEEVGNKGAALTSDITLPGRYLVLMPFSESGGVSRKIENESTRKKLKELITKLNIPEDVGLIVRTAGQGRTKSELQKDYQALIRNWGHSQARFEELREPGLVYREPDVVIRSIRDYFTDDVSEIVVDSDSVLERLTDYFEKHAPDIVSRVKRYRGKMPLFSNFGLERQLENISSQKVGLPSGGSIVVNPTEALTAIDVNSGKSRGQSNQEEMALQTNLEAAEEASRQLRLRDLGGLVVIDFIDMYENKNRRSVEKAVKNAMKRDKARVEVGRISRFGLLELSRQRIKARLISSTHNTCPMCDGSGFVMSTEVAAVTMLRRLQELAVSAPKAARVRGRLPVAVALHLLNEHRASIAQLEQDFSVIIEIIPEIGAVSTRDAFEILTRAQLDKPKEERSDRRDRKDRGRGRKKTHSNKRTDRDQSDTPYVPPKVVGFIEPEQLADADKGPEDEAETKRSRADSEEQPSGEQRGRRRRRRGRRNNDSESTGQSVPAPDQEAADGKDSDDDRRRREARERNLARRKARAQGKSRGHSSKKSTTDDDKAVAREKAEEPVREERAAKTEKPRKGRRPRNDESRTRPRDGGDAGRASQRAAAKLRGRLLEGDEGESKKAAPAKPAAKPAAKSAAKPAAKAAEKRKAPRRSASKSSVADRLKAKLQDQASTAAETPKEATKKKADTKPAQKGTAASRRAAAHLRAKLSGTDESPTNESTVKSTTKAEKPKRARTTKPSTDAAEKPKRTRAAKPKTDAASTEKPKRARATKSKAATTATEKPKRTRTTKAKTEAATAEKPKRTRAAKPKADTAKEKPKRARATKPKAEAAAKPKRTRTTKAKAETATEEKPKRTRTTKAKPKAETAAKKPRATRAKSAATKGAAKSSAKKAGDKLRQKLADESSATVSKDDLAREKAASVLATLNP